MINPYSAYTISFVIAVLLYVLGFSNLYPPLSSALLAFLLLSCSVFLAVGYLVFQKKRQLVFRPLNTKLFYAILITVFIYVLWGAEFIYEGGIPLLKIILKQPYNYRLFGIPSLHVFVVTFSSFYTIFLFHVFLSNRSKGIFFLYLLNLLAALLIFNRGMFVLNLAGSFFLLLINLTKIPKAILFIAPLSVVTLLYFFGMLGSIRVSREAHTPYSNRHFLAIGQASEWFRQSPIPDEYFWTYIYVTSPIANLQENINRQGQKTFSLKALGQLVNEEVVMDFISKRVNRSLGIMPVEDFRIPGPFNVSTVYSRPYSYLGWLGIIVICFILVILPFVYVKLIPTTSPFFLSGLAILCTMYLFLAFDNTIRFTGISFQLVYPAALHFLSGRFPFVLSFFVNNEVTLSSTEISTG